MFINNLFNNYSPFNNYSNYSYKSQPRKFQTPIYRNDNSRSIIINKLLNDDNNYICFDCYKKTNIIKYYDIKNAIFLCYNCTLNHTHLSSDITEVVAGDIRTLDDKYLLLLYYGGNKNLIEFIRLYYPLLERMDKNNMYSTKAMDYYRKLIRAKAFNEPEPNMPRKLEGYNSIFKNKINPANEINYNSNKKANNRDMMDIVNENADIYNSPNFGKYVKNKNLNLKEEPAVINNKNDDNEDEDIEMKDDTSQKSEDSTYEDAEGISDKENKIKNEKMNNKNYKNGIKTEFKIKNNKNEKQQNLTINQLGELSMYPDAKEIEEMD